MKKVLSVVGRFKPELIGGVIGAGAGWLYWYYVGCASGTCPITSSAVNSTLYGMVMGGLLFSMFKKEESVNSNK
ncbi:MAG: DUF6132 family protein [Chitinophagales bacterium]